MLHTVFVLFICWVMNESIQPNTVSMPFWIACNGATMSAPITVNTLMMKSRTLVKIVVAVVLMPVHTPDRNVVIDVHTPVTPPPIVCHRLVKKPAMPFHADCTPPVIVAHRLARNSPSPFHIALAPSTSAAHVSDSHEVNAAHALRPTSVWVKNQTSAATTVAKIVTQKPAGFALRTALKARWMAVPALVTAFHASCAFCAILVDAAIFWMRPEMPPMPLTRSVTPLAAFLTFTAALKMPSSPPATAVMPAVAVLKPRNAVTAGMSTGASLPALPTMRFNVSAMSFMAVATPSGGMSFTQSTTMLTTPMIAFLMVSHADLNAVIAPFSSSLE